MGEDVNDKPDCSDSQIECKEKPPCCDVFSFSTLTHLNFLTSDYFFLVRLYNCLNMFSNLILFITESANMLLFSTEVKTKKEKGRNFLKNLIESINKVGKLYF